MLVTRARTAAAATGLVLVLALAACSNASSPTSAPSATPTTTATATVTYIPPTTVTTTASPTTSAIRQVTKTALETLTPFATTGQPADGWSLGQASSGSVTLNCSDANPSPSSVSAGILECSPAAAVADSCYGARGQKSVLCLVDPFSRNVIRYQTEGKTYHNVDPPMDPKPIGLILDDRTQCRARVGGAWSAQAQHPDYVGYYSCDSGSGQDLAVWASQNSQSGGIDKSGDAWEVQVGDSHSALTTHTVAKAYVVGVA